MSLRAAISLVFLIGICIWTIRRPLIGVLANIVLFHINPRAFGAGMEDIRFQFFASILLLASFFINIQKINDENKNKLTPAFYILIAYNVYMYITCSWAVYSPFYALWQTFDFSKIVLFTYLMVKIVKTDDDFHLLIWTILISCFYVGFMGRWGVEFDWIDEDGMGIATGGAGPHLMMFFPQLVLFAVYGSKKEKMAAYFIMPFVLDYLTVTDDMKRASFVTLMASMGLFVVFTPMRTLIRSFWPMAVGALLFIFVLAPPGYFDYMSTIADPTEESSANSRFVINAASREMLADYPLGVGKGHYSPMSPQYVPESRLEGKTGMRDSHNTYYKVLCEIGIPGFILWLSVFALTWLAFRKIRVAAKKKKQAMTYLEMHTFGFEAAILGIVLPLYTHNMQDLDTLYWFVGFGVIVTNLYRKNPQGMIVASVKKQLEIEEEKRRKRQKLEEQFAKNRTRGQDGDTPEQPKVAVGTEARV